MPSLVIFFLLSLSLVGCREHVQEEAPPTFPVTVTEVVRRDIPDTFDLIGHLQAINSAQLVSQAAGQIIEIVPKEGSIVRKGDLLIRIDPGVYAAQVKLWKGVVEKDRAAVRFAEQQLESYRQLVAQNFVAPLTIAEYEADLAIAKGQLKADEGALDAAQVNLDFTYIKAPFDGIFGLLQVTVGNIFNLEFSNPFVATIQQISPIDGVFVLPENFLSRIKRYEHLGPMRVVATFVDQLQPSMEGELYAIDNVVNMQTGTINIKVRFHNETYNGWPGQFVRAKVFLHVDENVVAVPVEAVQFGSKGPFVFVVMPDQTVSIQPVTTGIEYEGYMEILEGLEGGEKIVTRGQLNLYPGAHVRIVSE